MNGINITDMSASSYYYASDRTIRASAEATYLDTASPYHDVHEELTNQRLWFLNRVVVNPSTQRRKGIGSDILQGLQKALADSGRCDVLLVTPGGYGVDPQEQRRFYQKNGFRIVHQDKQDGDAVVMIWRPAWSTLSKNK